MFIQYMYVYKGTCMYTYIQHSYTRAFDHQSHAYDPGVPPPRRGIFIHTPKPPFKRQIRDLVIYIQPADPLALRLPVYIELPKVVPRTREKVEAEE